MQTIAVGDLVTRKSHGRDVVFKVTDIVCTDENQTQCIIKGLHLRLMADAPLDDLERVDNEHLRNEIVTMECIYKDGLSRAFMRRSKENEEEEQIRIQKSAKYSFFDLPGRVLHLDGDEEYLKMCLKTYGQLNVSAVGHSIAEEKQPDSVLEMIKEYQPDIVVLTGHDALIGNGKKDYRNIDNYRNSKYFIQAVKSIRSYYPAKDEMVIFAGACQSYFEAILSAGANYCSSPSRIFIHAYDPVFIAEKVAFTPISRTVEISDAISASVTGVEGVGGLETRGKFRRAAPKTPYL